jgi:hypothetical protein
VGLFEGAIVLFIIVVGLFVFIFGQSEPSFKQDPMDVSMDLYDSKDDSDSK